MFLQKAHVVELLVHTQRAVGQEISAPFYNIILHELQ
jgi:hypothetical protein